jgi:membrane protein YdbS with pleckstrin-like domain
MRLKTTTRLVLGMYVMVSALLAVGVAYVLGGEAAAVAAAIVACLGSTVIVVVGPRVVRQRRNR